MGQNTAENSASNGENMFQPFLAGSRRACLASLSSHLLRVDQRAVHSDMVHRNSLQYRCPKS